MFRQSTIADSLRPRVRGLIGVLLMAIPPSTYAAEFLANNAAEITTALQQAQPGDTVVMANGVWTNQQIEFSADGAVGSPITLRAQTPGGVTLNGSSTLSISGDHLIADGLRFEGGALSSGSVVQFRGSNGEATNSRLTNSAIIDYNPASIDTRYFWVSLYGQSNRVDNNYFAGQDHSGVTVVVWRDTPTADFHRIDRNHFADRPEGNGNGFETIRVGTSDESLSNSFTVVENNLFERVDGEIEIISNKSGSNTYRHNTFRESAGTLTLRHGDNNNVEGNFFLGMGKDRSGGVRVIGEGQTVVNNYFNNLDGRAGGAISISAGAPNPPINSHFQVKNALIAHNTVVGVREAAIKFDEGLSSSRTLLAEDVTIANNLLWSNADPLFDGNEGPGWTWEGNLAFGQSLGPAAGNPDITVTDPQMTFAEDGLWRLTASSTAAIDQAVSGYSGVLSDDMDGQPRLGDFDIGADEFSIATIVRTPLSEGDVGPEWLYDEPPPGPVGGCNAGGCAVQAEDFASLLDPDGNGLTWSVVGVTDALGGAVIKAPGGDRVDLPAESHDAIASFDLEFETPGVYTAYYRARGFGGSSDSLFTPDGFGVDPDNNESLTSDGDFRWETGSSGQYRFTIAAGQVGVPLEFRLAMREQQAELDAFVLSLDADLTPAELDALFAVTPGDYNGDGVVDGADYTVWRDTLNDTGPGLAADGDGNGVVDLSDYLVWRDARIGSLSTTIPEPTALALLTGAVGSFFRSQRRIQSA